MSISEIIALVGGVALFLFGMGYMGDSLKKLSGDKLESIFHKLLGTTLRGVLVGTGVTAVIQSSSATAVMTVGFVNSRMMKVRQGISIILGAILGTSITGWVVCLSYIGGADGVAQIISTATLTGLVAVIGIVLKMFVKKQLAANIGDILMGFAILMYGMSAMSGAVAGLGESEWFTSTLTEMSNPVFLLIIGMLFTMLLQSASASVGIVQALSVTGALTFDMTFPVLMGISIGAAAPVLFSAIGASVEGRRTAAVYPIITTLGVVVVACIYNTANIVVRFPFTSSVMNPFSIALVNTLMRFAMVLVLAPSVDIIEAIVNAIVKEKTDAEDQLSIRLEERFLAYPALAIEQSRLTINRMAEVSEKSLNLAFTLFSDYTEKGFAGVKRMENDVDAYEDSLGTYLVKMTGREMTASQNAEISKYLHTLSDFERISDHALNIAGSAKELTEKKEVFSESAVKELSVLYSAVSQEVSLTVNAFCNEDMNLAVRVEPLEEVIDELCERIKMNHVERLQQGNCSIPAGFVLNDILTNCSRISDHCSNIAVAMIELSDNEFQTHEYMHTLREKETPVFHDAYREYSERFVID